jgi:hypothetical protein
MNTENLILLKTVSTLYQVEPAFFSHLNELGLIEIHIIEQTQYIREDKMNDIEKMIRMYHELEVNVEGIDVVFNLLQRIERLQKDLITTQNRLKLYEG